ncbi:unnamed protein product [Owenia fusiformis]|uniref:C-type lectin domain-containing protein n=1 Tax=Owenia fusiformis TaxID=6347 RepID=A0A8S4NZM6_OWEFU|nr:unnamed protein product [Owenia fusiformis]
MSSFPRSNCYMFDTNISQKYVAAESGPESGLMMILLTNSYNPTDYNTYAFINDDTTGINAYTSDYATGNDGFRHKIINQCKNDAGCTTPKWGCPSNFIKHGNSCYKFEYTRTATWCNANIACFNLNAHLVAIESEAEQNYLSAKITADGKKGLPYHIWIGGNNLAGEGWKWAAAGLGFTSKPMGYTHWGNGQPDNENNNENCVHIGAWKHTWNDNKCAHRKYYICEINL